MGEQDDWSVLHDIEAATQEAEAQAAKRTKFEEYLRQADLTVLNGSLEETKVSEVRGFALEQQHTGARASQLLGHIGLDNSRQHSNPREVVEVQASKLVPLVGDAESKRQMFGQVVVAYLLDPETQQPIGIQRFGVNTYPDRSGKPEIAGRIGQTSYQADIFGGLLESDEAEHSLKWHTRLAPRQHVLTNISQLLDDIEFTLACDDPERHTLPSYANNTLIY